MYHWIDKVFSLIHLCDDNTFIYTITYACHLYCCLPWLLWHLNARHCAGGERTETRKDPFLFVMSTQLTPGSIISPRNSQTTNMVRETNLIRKWDENTFCPSHPKISTEKLSYLTCVELLRNHSFNRRFRACVSGDLCANWLKCSVMLQILNWPGSLALRMEGGDIYIYNEVCNEIGLWIWLSHEWIHVRLGMRWH